MTRWKSLPILFCTAIGIAACSSSGGRGDSTAATVQPSATSSVADTTGSAATPADQATVAAIDAAIGSAPSGCDPLDTTRCLLPFPSDAYLVDDQSTPSGHRVNLPADGMPANAQGVKVDPTQWNRNDGFSADASLLTYVAGLDATGLPSWTDLQASLNDDATVVLVDAETGDRVPLWAELDDADIAADRLLVIHPAVSLEPNTTYAVGLRGLRTTTGEAVAPSPVFRVFRDRLTTGIQAIESRRPSMEAGITALEQAGVVRDDLQLAWTFTTASTDDVTGRIITMRDATMTALGSNTPEFEITSVNDNPDDQGLARLVEGTYSVPNYLSGDGGPGSSMLFDNTGTPVVNAENPIVKAPFACEISDATMAGGEPAHLVQYGHGLLGSHLEITAGNVIAMSNEHNAVYCATKWAGFSEDDVGTAVRALGDLSVFPSFIDRMTQGMLNQLVLGRLMLAPDGLVAEPAFARTDGSLLIDNSTLYYDGNSQGGIMGMALAGVSQDFTRAVLGVPGMNYSTLLPRSSDFTDYEAILTPAYPNALDRQLLVSVIQMLWDRTEGAGYVRHVVSDPLPGTPAKEVLMHVAFGDWQVSELTAMIAARSMGIPISRPVTAAGRSREVDPGWGLESINYPSTGSGLVVWDSGSDPIPISQTAPSTGRDPHEDPRNDANARKQKAAFLFDGTLIDVCSGGPCRAQPS